MASNSKNTAFEGAGLPFSNEAEQSVLGAILIDPPSINEVLSRQLKTEHFYIPQNRRIFEVLSSMSALNQTIDFIAVLEKIKDDELFEGNSAKAYLSSLVEVVPSSANIVTYADIVKDRFTNRSLISISRDIIDMASSGQADSNTLLESAEQKIYDIRQGRDVTGLKSIKDVIDQETFIRLSKISNPETRKEYVGIPTGFSALDRVITGLNKSDLIIVGARPGMGKTAFALNVARNVALQSGKKVCFFSLEMSRDQLAQRLLSSEAMIESSKMRTGELTTDDWVNLNEASKRLKETQIYIDETSGITVPEMKAKLRRLKDVDMVIVDYLGLMQSAKRTENRVQEVSDITRNLKIMAKELGIPVMVCAQLGRGTEAKGKSHKPALSDLRESGSIEQDADIVLFMYRDLYYKDENQDPNVQIDEHKAECIVAKNRHGGLDTIPLYWDGQYTRFSTVDVIG